MLKNSSMKEIVDYLLNLYKVNSITEIPTEDKVDFLCYLLATDTYGLDQILSQNSPVLRTVRGHTFETYFDEVLHLNGYSSQEMGGDSSIDRVVNGHTLQLKTPYKNGTKHGIAQYKTHKTHGAKSEQESMSYYHKLSSFSDFFVGLISYNPQQFLILHKSQLPLVSTNDNISRIKSPFSIDLTNTDGINAFHKLGVSVNPESILELYPNNNEILPETVKKCGVTTEVIVNTIINKSNFRVWDMAIKGFAREYAFEKYAAKINLHIQHPKVTGRPRYDKADFVIENGSQYLFLQMKGLSIGNCKLDLEDPILGTETQLTRGRVNDHPTQSRLYLVADFDYLLLAVDPTIVSICNKIPLSDNLSWEFYKIPVSYLQFHPKFNNRLKSVQKFYYSELEKFRM